MSSIYKVHMWSMSPPTPVLPSKVSTDVYKMDTYYWTWYHARFNQDLHMGHGPPTVGMNTRMHQCCAMVVLEVKSWGVEQDLIPSKWQLVVASVPAKGWFVQSYEYSFFHNFIEGLWFPSHYAETVHTSMMACNITMFINGRRDFEVLFKPLSKTSCRFPNILFITLYPVTHIPIVTPLFHVMVSLSLGATRIYMMVLPPLKRTCIPCLLQIFLEL